MRIKHSMFSEDAIQALCQDNSKTKRPGGLDVCRLLVHYGSWIDPLAAVSGFSYLMYLDELGVYGSDIFGLYHDVCEGDLAHMVALLRAYKLGHVSKDDILAVIELGGGFDLQKIVNDVVKAIPGFRPDALEEVPKVSGGRKEIVIARS